MKPIILTFVCYYLPGYKSGGPIRTIANLVEHLGDNFDFRIVTSDRDALDTGPYSNVTVDAWNTVGQAQVFYSSPYQCSFRNVARLIKSTPHHVLYLNSFFSPVFTLRPLLARWLGMVPTRPTVIAPRGEFSRGAIALKRPKKAPYRVVGKAVGLFGDVTWQASSDFEVQDIQRTMGRTAGNIVVAPNLPHLSGIGLCSEAANPTQRNGVLRVCFLARITPMKNLDYALQVLARVHGPVEFNIVGPIRDERYWSECKALIGKLPNHVNAKWLGGVEHAKSASVIAEHDLLFLPTRGENYGHVILEALVVGTPVLIANTTPWRGLFDAGVGWDLPLEDDQSFVEAIEHAAALDSRTYMAWRERVAQYGRTRSVDPDVVDANRRLFTGVSPKVSRDK